MGPTTIPHQASMWTLLTKQLSNSFLKEKCPKGFNNIYSYSEFTSSKKHRELEGKTGIPYSVTQFTIYDAVSHEKYVILLHESVPTKAIDGHIL